MAKLKNLELNGKSVQGKTAICIGANAGLGFAKCEWLVENNIGRLVMGCRSLDKAEKAKSEIEKKNTGDTEIIIIKIDLSSLESIKSFGDQWSDQDPSCRKCDLLFCNAGLIVPNADMSTTEDNFEMTYQCNALGHLALIEHLLPALSESDDPRIIVTSSNGAKLTDIPNAPSENPRTPLRDVRKYKNYALNSFALYSDSKKLITILCRELQTSLDNHPNVKYRKIFVANYHPGFVKTTISNKEEYKALKVFSVPVNMLVNTFAISAPEGAKTALFLATCSLQGKPRGAFWNEKTQPQSVGKQAEDTKLRRAYWDRCVKDAGVNPESFPLPPL
ncbi:Retinol dehydrogenase 14 [Wallemia ichthyophaga EXF-994]|uniref:Retinol dehydrogenase 14 n=1 Tax=Wallemia ichthyophaga (strain EXF-994 / CBS 113033) TaxID=1299270 RepID=R9ANP8_WALI9|nr:Retinol dehydrogenase 14 [Wallemia ichthyophaga EXF-994]EOR03778.1 Retinol dehydrogenase 14 [Wallemia ichthyophaga EXF-994]